MTLLFLVYKFFTKSIINGGKFSLFKRLISGMVALTIIFFSFAYSAPKSEKIKSFIYNELSLTEAHYRVCKASPVLCHTSERLIPYFNKYIYKMYYSVVKHESGNFKYRIGLYDKNDLGLPQINVRFWNYKKARAFGFKVSAPRYKWKLIHDDKFSLRLGFTIFWYNIVYGFYNGNRYPAILDYSACYHQPTKKNRDTRIYIKKIKYLYYNTK